MPIVNQYLVLHSGDRIRMKVNSHVLDIKDREQYLNDNLEDELKYYMKDVKESASHIELVLTHKDK